MNWIIFLKIIIFIIFIIFMYLYIEKKYSQF